MPAANGPGNSPRTPSDEGSNLSAKITRIVRQEMGDTWRHDPNFFKKFFPVNIAFEDEIPDIQAKLYNSRQSRWKGIGAKIKSVASLSTKLLHILNGMLDDGLKKKRMYYKTTKPRKVFTGRKPVTTPSLFLAGTGPEFANTGCDLPFAQYAQGIAPIEVRLHSSDDTQGHGRLAVHARELFTDQENRRFLFGVVLTQHSMTVCMFDRAGALFSDPLDYHADPAQFCAVILGLAKNDATSVGFDMTIYREGRSMKLRTSQDAMRRTRSDRKIHGKGTLYTVKARIFCQRKVIGKGTMCWRAVDDFTKEECVIKDTWIAPEELPGRESEADLLWHVQRKGLTRGVAQIRHCEAVLLPTSNIPDTVMRNRQFHGALDPAVERVHTRLVIATYGKTLDQFSSRRELLLAYHDVVVAHHNLYETAGILHRDISVRNILINSEGKEGDRGILIDFDNAIRVDDPSPYSQTPKVATWPYMSRKLTLKKGNHTYFDDLESFYYVFYWIAVGYLRPGVPRSPLPAILKGWTEDYSWTMKNALIIRPFDLPVSEWFGNSIRELCVRLHSFYHNRMMAESLARVGRQEPPRADPSEDYEEYLGHIRQAISDLEKEELERGTEFPESPDGDNKREVGAEESDQPEGARPLPRQRKKDTHWLPPVARPRRATANYK